MRQNEEEKASSQRRMLHLTRRAVLRNAGIGVAGATVLGIGAIELGRQRAQGAVVAARMADSLVDSIGVNTHFGYTDRVYFQRFDEVKVKLAASGIRHIRDGVDDRDFVYTKINELYNTYGIKVIQGLNTRVKAAPEDVPWDSSGPLDFNQIDYLLGVIKAHYANSNEGIEGPNEYDINHSDRFASDPNWAATLRNYTQTLWNKVQADSVLKLRPVIQPSMAHASNAPTVGNMSGWISYGNMHPYPGAQHPATETHLSNYNIPNTQTISGSKTIWATETGYHNATDQAPGGHYACSEAASGKYGPRLAAEYFRIGVGRSYFYEFCDEGTNNAEQEDRFGLIRNDLSEKPIYGALRSMISLLKDPGPAFTPGTLNYSLSGDLTNIRQVLLQKRNGTFYLLLWQEVSCWNRNTYQNLSNPDRSLTLTVQSPAISTMRIYKPTTNGTHDTAAYSNPGSIGLGVPDHLMIIELQPSGGSTLTRAINCGGGAVSPFVADAGFSGGNAHTDTSQAINTSGVSNPAPQAVYQTKRWGQSFSYTIGGLTAGSSYTVRLHFAELTFGATGQRVFTVALNGSTVLSNFDVVAAAGAWKKAVVRAFTATANSSGQLVLAFSRATADNPFISAIEVSR